MSVGGERRAICCCPLSFPRMWAIEKATTQMAKLSARGRAQPLEKQVAPTLSIFAGDVRPFAGQTINVFAEESLPTSLSWPEKPGWAERLKGKSKLMFNWWPGASCAFVKLDTGASWWSQAARAESGFGGAGAYQNTSVVQSTSTFSRVPPPEAWMVRLAAASAC